MWLRPKSESKVEEEAIRDFFLRNTECWRFLKKGGTELRTYIHNRTKYFLFRKPSCMAISKSYPGHLDKFHKRKFISLLFFHLHLFFRSHLFSFASFFRSHLFLFASFIRSHLFRPIFDLLIKSAY